MVFDTYLAVGGPIFIGAMLIISTALKWPSWVNYIWAAITILWGFIPLL